ncbi:GntR family transcriptional regulator [Fusobacterium russii]|uniref:GntR family transcriptional regulator n=1 Tax=Fusobacterium russii TaxID=854 RepID=UPI0003AB0116|nr:GntR family transcriptional regulator [Fusobacterium russii]
MAITKTKSIREQVYDNLKEMIINGELKSGTKIIELEYAKKFDVSRTPIREALRMLELEGLVDNSDKGGVTVTFISKEDIRQVYEIRVALENLIIEEIIRHKKNNLKKIEKIFEKTKKYMNESKSIDEIIKLFSEFNNELYELSGLYHVSKLITNINQYTKRFRRLCLFNEVRLKEAYEEHLELIDAIKNKNREKAIKINTEHLLKSRDFVLKNYVFNN